MEVIVPFSTDRPKSRLSGVLSPDERGEFARAMLDDVLDAVAAAGGEPRVLATDAVNVDPPVTVDDRPLTDAVNAALDARIGVDPEDDAGEGDAGTDGSQEPVAVVMADLALATPAALDRLFAAGRDADVAMAPGRGGGTNAFVASHPEFRVDYHGASYLDHREIAAEIGAEFVAVDSRRLGTDVDEPADLAEVLIHGEGRAATWLREAGFALDASEGRVAAVRK
ncbi:2-phospho-L-lactate guanylyltransferase [Halorubrum trapanicum]|uniref:2-phospho-L-lactate guanylyltransferase n=1 Tax=Halorubrum trapanicum TaxID=29284 RepID=A0A8J7R6D1_9EURY|nr:2-phospho-L-lactate guanylyltransferase [Halorubrum trapanicum]MBP1900974.1 2-phospho-L-lactate guanylyltransferase [Halorubrum trapanicum]